MLWNLRRGKRQKYGVPRFAEPMRAHWVVLGLGIGIPSALLSYHFKTSTWTEVIGYTTYTHRFNPILWQVAAVIALLGLVTMVLGLGLDAKRPRMRGSAPAVCPHCGTPRSSRFCQNCGAMLE